MAKKKFENIIEDQDSLINHIPNPFGPPMMYTAMELWLKFEDYTKWANRNPLLGSKVVGKELVPEPRLRAWTEGGFCLFAGIDTDTFRKYKTGEIAFNDPTYKRLALMISESIREQKFTGASADLLNANIISRDLGLADKKEVTANINLSDKPIEFE
jgi:hypothetical protein